MRVVRLSAVILCVCPSNPYQVSFYLEYKKGLKTKIGISVTFPCRQKVRTVYFQFSWLKVKVTARQKPRHEPQQPKSNFGALWLQNMEFDGDMFYYFPED